MRLALTLLLASVVLIGIVPACKEKPRQSGSILSDAEAAKSGGKTGALDEVVVPGALPEHWPEHELPPYPAARIVEGRSRNANGVLTLKTSLTTPDSGQQVSDYYGARAADAGYQIVSSSRTERKSLSVYQRGAENFAVNIDEGELTQIQLDLTGTLPQSAANGAAAGDAKPVAATGSGAGSTTDPDSGTGGADDSDDADDNAPSHRLIPVYPGADSQGLVGAIDMVSLNMTTDDDGAKVQTYYHDFYTDRGFKETMTFNLGTQISVTYGGPEGEATVVTGEAPANEAAGEPARTMIYVSFKPASAPPM